MSSFAYMAWPAGVPFEAEIGSWQEGPSTNIAEFPAEVGPPKRRRRTHINSTLVQFDILMTGAELSEFEDFYADDCLDGTNGILAVDPRLEVSSRYLFSSNPAWRDAGHDLWRVSLSLRRMPTNA